MGAGIHLDCSSRDGRRPAVGGGGTAAPRRRWAAAVVGGSPVKLEIELSMAKHYGTKTKTKLGGWGILPRA
jgi:hypothetical protein